MRVAFSLTFALFLRISGVAAFASTVVPTSTGSTSSRLSSKLSASFLDELSKTFSNMGAPSSSKYFTVGITGSGGLIGTALRDELSKREALMGKKIRVVRLMRGPQAQTNDLEDSAGEMQLIWNPLGGGDNNSIDSVISNQALKEMDVIIHLAGENISTGMGPLAALGIRPWTDAKKKEIIDSRQITTSALAKAIASSKKKISFLVASGVGVYGPNFVGENVAAVDESANVSDTEGFLAQVVRQWESASQKAKSNGSRVVNMRNGVVLSTKGGALAKLFPIFFVGGGGIVGSGQQYFPFISARDMARAMIHVMETPKLAGPVNMCAPDGCTNAEFTEAMGAVLKRPTILPLPGFAVSLLFGEMGQEVLLGGTRANPSKLLSSGFQFLHPTVEEAVQSAVGENI
jgi:uncharacterized protein (TIGR01777 family)